MPKDILEVETIARGVLTWGSAILLCRNVKGGYRYLPGGHVEFGEPAAVALAREFEEETGVQVRVGGCELVHEHIFRQSGRLRHELNVVFHVEHPAAFSNGSTPPPVVSREKKIAFEWVEVSDLGSASLQPDVIVAWLSTRNASPAPRVQWLSTTDQ